MFFVANRFNLADEAWKDALCDVYSFCNFCKIHLGCERVWDAATLLKFRYLLEERKLGAAPPSTKNQDKSRDPEMRLTKKGS